MKTSALQGRLYFIESVLSESIHTEVCRAWECYNTVECLSLYWHCLDLFAPVVTIGIAIAVVVAIRVAIVAVVGV